MRIAIQPDEVIHPNGERQSFSARWIQLARSQPRHVETILVDAFAPDAVDRISGCAAFMWRYPSSAHSRLYAKRLAYAIESGFGIPVFPSVESTAYFEDKPAQRFFLEAAGIPAAKTVVFWSRPDAMRFCDNAAYPFVLKLAGGHQSANVRLVRNRHDAMYYIDALFGRGLVSLGYRPASRPRRLLRRLRAAVKTAEGHSPYAPTAEAEVQYGYFYAQEFLPDNAFEVSVIIIGNRAFAVRRFNQPGDFRTRGSTGRMDWDPGAIDEDAVRLAYRVAQKLNAETIAVDILRRGAKPVVAELTVNYASWVVRECPGHWVLRGNPLSGSLDWVEGHDRAEDAVFADFLAKLMHSPTCKNHHATCMHFPAGQPS